MLSMIKIVCSVLRRRTFSNFDVLFLEKRIFRIVYRPDGDFDDFLYKRFLDNGLFDVR